MNGDITYCIAKCENKKHCFRNPENRPFKNLPYSIANFSESCKEYKVSKNK